jgi:hypothetical protein
MSTHEFRIVVDWTSVKGEYGVPGSEPQVHPAELPRPDPLILHTVTMINRWLCFWDRIHMDESKRLNKDKLIQPRDLQVLGTYLWQILLNNQVGTMLKDKIPKEGSKTPLRLSIEFTQGADEKIKGLPWEFLYEPTHGWFLATKTELLLTRYVSAPERSADVATVGDREDVRALLIAALPPGDLFDPHRIALGKLRTALKDVNGLAEPELIDSWLQEDIAAKLKSEPYHVVHVVGICRGDPGSPEIFLGGGGDGFQDPAEFVQTLTANPTRPRLIILHLCDYVDGDATENFERLAPALVQREVPAVLALQYAIKISESDNVGLGKKFYEKLVAGAHVGAAVQESREELRSRYPGQRFFGTPVLYLEDDEPFRPSVAHSAGDASTAQPAPVRTTTVRTVLLKVVANASDLSNEEENRLLRWLAALSSEVGLGGARARIQEALLSEPRAPIQRVYSDMLIALGKLERAS